MYGPRLLVASMVPRGGSPRPFKHGNRWQYHSRSDHHSKLACWGLMLDMLSECSLLREQMAAGLVGFGINHEIRDFRTGRKKDLDLVICRPRGPISGSERTFAQRGLHIGVVLDDAVRTALDALPEAREVPVGAVHIAVEAKACMTAFSKARPRLYDELNSSHLTIHGNSEHIVAAGLAMVNVAEDFISPGRNDFSLAEHEPVVSHHTQPRDAASVVEKLNEMPRRSREGEEGFDAFAITIVECRNNGSPVRLVETPPAPQLGEIYHYEAMVHRLAQLYEQKFGNI